MSLIYQLGNEYMLIKSLEPLIYCLKIIKINYFVFVYFDKCTWVIFFFKEIREAFKVSSSRRVIFFFVFYYETIRICFNKTLVKISSYFIYLNYKFILLVKDVVKIVYTSRNIHLALTR